MGIAAVAMNKCFVCASALESGQAACPGCGTEVATLVEIKRASQKQRFLFGRMETETCKPPVSNPTPPMPAKPAVRRKKAKPPPGQSDLFSEPPAEFDHIRERDILPPLGPMTPAVAGPSRWASYLIDVSLCLVLNLSVLRLVLWLSHRDLFSLITFSLVPLLFVFLSFTVLYFWLFSGLLKKSLGRIIAERLQA